MADRSGTGLQKYPQIDCVPLGPTLVLFLQRSQPTCSLLRAGGYQCHLRRRKNRGKLS